VRKIERSLVRKDSSPAGHKQFLSNGHTSYVREHLRGEYKKWRHATAEGSLTVFRLTVRPLRLAIFSITLLWTRVAFGRNPKDGKFCSPA
jgi:hypothetical protein